MASTLYTVRQTSVSRIQWRKKTIIDNLVAIRSHTCTETLQVLDQTNLKQHRIQLRPSPKKVPLSTPSIHLFISANIPLPLSLSLLFLLHEPGRWDNNMSLYHEASSHLLLLFQNSSTSSSSSSVSSHPYASSSSHPHASSSSLSSQIYSDKSLKTKPGLVYKLVVEAAKWSRVVSEVVERAGVLGEKGGKVG